MPNSNAKVHEAEVHSDFKRYTKLKRGRDVFLASAMARPTQNGQTVILLQKCRGCKADQPMERRVRLSSASAIVTFCQEETMLLQNVQKLNQLGQVSLIALIKLSLSKVLLKPQRWPVAFGPQSQANDDDDALFLPKWSKEGGALDPPSGIHKVQMRCLIILLHLVCTKTSSQDVFVEDYTCK